MRFTVEDIMAENPCYAYPYDRVVDLWNGRKSLSPYELAQLPIPMTDRIWALGRLLYRMSPWRANRLARVIALDVIFDRDPPDIVWWYLVTGDTATRDAAWDAAGATARDAVEAALTAAEEKYLSWFVQAIENGV